MSSSINRLGFEFAQPCNRSRPRERTSIIFSVRRRHRSASRFTERSSRTNWDAFLSLARPSLSAGKCKTLSVAHRRGRTKAWYCDNVHQFWVAHELIPTMSVAETAKYLGLRFGANGALSAVKEDLDSMLKRVTAAPLKPAQRLWILQTHTLVTSLFCARC